MPPSSAGKSRGTVVFLGDSNEVFPAKQVGVALLDRSNGYIVVNVARPGASIRFGGPTNDYWLERIADTRAAMTPDAWVINLGINDTAGPGSTSGRGYASYDTKIDWLLSKLGKAPVIWTNLPTKIEPAFRAKGCNAVNAALAQAKARHANLHVLDWAAIANDHPAFIGPPREVHLTDAGCVAWATLIARGLDALFPIP